MKVQSIRGQRLRVELVVDVEVLEIGLIVLFPNLDACTRVERHRKVEVECGRTAELLPLGRLDVSFSQQAFPLGKLQGGCEEGL